MAEKEKKIFIADKRVKEIKDTDKRTPGNGMIREVIFENGASAFLPHERIMVVQTDHVSTLTEERKKLVKKISEVVWGYFHEFDLTLEEAEDVMNEVTRLANASAEKAANILFGVEFAPQRSLLKINEVLTKYHSDKQPEQKGGDAAPSGGGVADQPNKE